MLQHTRRARHCALCTSHVAEWLAPSASRHGGRRHFALKRGLHIPKAQAQTAERHRLVPSRVPLIHILISVLFQKPHPSPAQNTSSFLERVKGYKNPLEFGKRPSKYAILHKLLTEQHEHLVLALKDRSALASHTRNTWGIKSKKHLEEVTSAFRWKMDKSIALADEGTISEDENPLFYRLRHAFIHADIVGLKTEMQYAFMNSVLGAPQYSDQVDSNQKALSDLRYPVEWFPGTRTLQRKIHLHVGPTNSGKTYHALQRLEQAKSGIYAGPLRLLAHEVYTRLNAKGIPCSLVTGEERRIPEGVESYMSSCTVEMVPLNTTVEVAVIDEIQMMGNIDRGWAWTQAFLGVMAKEVHLCGEARTVSLIRDLCAAMGDELIVHEYKRLSPLKMAKFSLKGDARNLRKGDAVILFSRIQLHAMKQHIEVTTGRRCAIVYGSLPPETRAQQASLFNDPDNDYDFLVASDAVGMGLNLSIKRIVFETTWKHDGSSLQLLSTPELKQIAGRAGRYRTARDATVDQPIDLTDGEPVDIQPPLQVPEEKENVGYVTTFEGQDLQIVRSALDATPEPLRTANILPPTSIVTRFASYFPPNTPFSYILLRLNAISTLSPHFKLCRLRDQIGVADVIQASNLSVKDRMIFTSAPVALRDPGFPQVVAELAECVAQQSNGDILEIKSMPFYLLGIKPEEHRDGKEGFLRAIELLHKAITLYLWLSYRFSGVFQSQALGFHLKDLVEEKINDSLGAVEHDAEKRKRRLERHLKLLQREEKKTKTLVSEPDLFRESELAGDEYVDILSTHENSDKESADDNTQEQPEVGEDTPNRTNQHPL